MLTMRCLPWALTLFALLRPTSVLAEQTPDRVDVSFERDVRPILKAHCFHCHGEAGVRKGNLDLRLRRWIVQGGDSGPAVEPGKGDESYLLQRIVLGEMPPGKDKQLSQQEIAVITRWIEAGAPTARPEPESLGDEPLITEEERNWWAFRPLRRPPLPKVQRPELVQTPIDAFLLARLESQGLSFSRQADRRTLIRRASLDLRGLPPSPEEVEAFVHDESPDAWGRLVERLLASPHYGERWGRHWLDLAGYADSEGASNEDPERPWAYKYRDYVIRSFNENKPFDQFICEQLAGDEMIDPPYRNLSAEAIEKLTATGFLRMAPDGTATGGADRKTAANLTIAQTMQIVSTSLLGLTVGCAECHDHRYDPIPQSDYYRLRAVFEPALDWSNWRTPRQRLVSLYTDADREEAARIEAEAKKIDAARAKKQAEFIEQTFQRELAKLPEDVRDKVRVARNTPAGKRTAEQKALLKQYPSVNVTAGSLYLYDRKAADELKRMAKEAADLRATKPREEFIRALTEIPGRVPTTHVFHRGDFEQPREAVAPAGLSVLSHLEAGTVPENDPQRPTSGRRLAFARRLTSGRHPLTPRVIVNQIWLHHFGHGLVRTPGDFGRLGEPPTHPQLLDWLADEFIRSGWDVKHLQRLILHSTAYRQVSGPVPDAVRQKDPDNRLYSRMSIRRLEAETLRDSMLSVSGLLHDGMYGEPVPIKEDEVGQVVVGIPNVDSAGRPQGEIPMGPEQFRRSVYIKVRRSQPLDLLETFDLPRMDPNCTSRTPSTVAPQALSLMNGQFIVHQAEAFAARLVAEVGDDRDQQIRRAWNLAYGREPTEDERLLALEYLEAQAKEYRQRTVAAAQTGEGTANDQNGTDPQSARLALSTLCQALLSSNEFLYVD